MNARFVSVCLIAAVALLGPLRAESVEESIARARAYLGEESALNRVTTIHFTGSLEIARPPASGGTGGATPVEKFPVEIIFQKPYQQQMTVFRSETIDTMVLDDYDGWSRTTSRKDPKQWRVNLLDADQIKQLRANTWENLSFYAGLERRGGTVQGGGETSVDGVLCDKLSFVHSERIVFHRYFDKATGRLVKTDTGNGSEIREEGEIVAEGIRFPRRIINRAGTGQTTTIVFESVVLNERIPAAAFAVPSFNE